MECFPFWPTYIGEKDWILGKTYGIIMTCYLEHLWGTHWELREHIGNLMGTNGNLKKTYKEHVGKKRKNERKTSHFDATWMQLGLPHPSIIGIF